MRKPVNAKFAAAMPVVGFLLIAASFLLKHLGVNLVATYFISGVGCAWVGIGVISIFAKRQNPESVKKREIAQKDERNIQIREKSGYVAYLVTLFTLMIWEFISLILDDDLACMLAIGAMIVHLLSFFIALFYYDKTR